MSYFVRKLFSNVESVLFKCKKKLILTMIRLIYRPWQISFVFSVRLDPLHPTLETRCFGIKTNYFKANRMYWKTLSADSRILEQSLGRSRHQVNNIILPTCRHKILLSCTWHGRINMHYSGKTWPFL